MNRFFWCLLTIVMTMLTTIVASWVIAQTSTRNTHAVIVPLETSRR